MFLQRQKPLAQACLSMHAEGPDRPGAAGPVAVEGRPGKPSVSPCPGGQGRKSALHQRQLALLGVGVPRSLPGPPAFWAVPGMGDQKRVGAGGK